MSNPFEFQTEWCRNADDRCVGCPIPRLKQENPAIAEQVLKMVDRFGLNEVAEAREETETQYDSYKFGTMVELSGKAVQEYPMEGYELANGAIKQIAAMHPRDERF